MVAPKVVQRIGVAEPVVHPPHVGVEREARGVVAEPALHLHGVAASLVQQRAARLAKDVEGHPAEADRQARPRRARQRRRASAPLSRTSSPRQPPPVSDATASSAARPRQSTGMGSSGRRAGREKPAANALTGPTTNGTRPDRQSQAGGPGCAAPRLGSKLTMRRCARRRGRPRARVQVRGAAAVCQFHSPWPSAVACFCTGSRGGR
jgi:hypothetical protein